MMRSNRNLWLARAGSIAAIGLAAAAAARAQAAPAPAPAEARPIDLAICLDTSGSMNGLIDSAKQKLWAIVNDLALAQPAPRLRVALLTFGNESHDAAKGWVQVQTPFTEDLDLVSQKLFVLTTNGGTEYVGRVLADAERLDWSPSAEALRLVVVAGNESADQDQEVPFRQVCPRLIAQGIMVNSIYCGNPADELAPVWREVALLADGKFAAIDQDAGTVVVETPFDRELAELSAALNATYLPYGASGQTAAANQVAQDFNAVGSGVAVAAQRAVTKGCSTVYKCSNWDLVDASKDASFKLEEVAEADLPEAMRAMSPQERRAHVERMDAERTRVQARIAELGQERERFVTEQMKQQGLDDSRALDRVLRDAIRSQAASRGFAFPAAPAPPVASSTTGP
jgi:hypothetical protein